MYRENSSYGKALRATLAAILLGATSAMAAVPATGDKVGGLFKVNTQNVDSGTSVATDAVGDSVVVWTDLFGTASVTGQRYDADGNKVGAEFPVTSDFSESGKVAMDATGNFVVVWVSANAGAENVFARLYDNTGTPRGPQFQVNQAHAGQFPNSTEAFTDAVAMDATGNFVVAWTSNDAGDGITPDAGIFAQRFDATGAALTGTDIAVNVTTTGRQASPTIAMSPSGSYVISWTGVDAGNGITPDQGIYAQLYDSTGAVTKAEFLVNTDTSDPEFLPAAGMNLTGDFVVAWTKVEFGGSFGPSDVHAQIFDATGAAVGGEFLVNAAALGNQTNSTTGKQSHATVAMDVNGNFVIGWDSEFDTTGALGSYANFYNPAGTLVRGAKTQGLSDTGFAPAAAMDAGGDVFFAAQGTSNAVSGIYGQRFAGFGSVDLSAALNTTAAAVVKPGDNITLTANITNNEVAGTPTGIAAIDGALSTATTVQAAITLPAGTLMSSASGTGWTCPGAPTADVLTCTFAGGLAAGVVSSDLTVNLQASDTGGVSSFTHDASGLQPDASAGNNEASVGVTVDHPPVANDGSLVVALNTATPGNAVATDADGDPLIYSVVTTPANGNVTVNPDGSFSYTPNTGFTGHDTFTFKANDGNFDSNNATITLRVNNQAPVATDGTLTTDEDTAGLSSVAATDADGDSLTFSKVSDPANGTVVVNANGSYSYTPNADFNGTDSFTFRANDGLADSNTATVNITVNAVNDAPGADDGILTVVEDSGANPGTVTGTDVEGDALTFALVTGAAHGTAVVNPDGSYTYTPAPDFSGSDSFTFKANDGSLDSNTATVTITVTGVNDAPVAADGTLTVDEDSTGNTGNAVATDADADGLTYSLVGGVSNGTLTFNADGSFSYAPAANFNGSDSFSFKVNDGTVDSNTATVTITVNPVDDAPVATDGTLTVGEDSGANPGTVTGTDLEGDALTFALVTGAAHGTAVVNADGSYTYTPAPDFSGSDSFTFKANDGTKDSAAGTVTITVTGVNDAPVAADKSIGVLEDSSNNGDLVIASDVDGDSLSYSLVGGVSNGTLTFNADGSFSYTPNAGFVGADSFTYKANDGSVDSNVATVSYTVTHVNHAPVAADGAQTVDEDSTGNTGSAVAADSDADTLTYSVVTNVAHGALTLNADGSYSYSPAANFNGTDSFTFKANDGTVDSNVGTVTFTVTSVNDAPVATAGTLAVNRNTAKIGTLAVTDLDGDALTYITVRAPAHGRVTLHTDGTFTYKPEAGFSGTDSFKFKANDGTADSNAVVVSITVTEHAPVGTAQSFSMTHNTTHKGTVTATDKDTGDHLTFSKVALPKHGTLTMTTAGAFTYKPATGFKGKDSFTFKVSDGVKADLSTTVSITVK